MILAIKRFLWVIAVLALALTFPMQVLSNNPNAALLGYVPVILIYALPATRGGPGRQRWRGVDLVVGLYLSLILGHILIGLAAGGMSAAEAARQAFLFVLPATFYPYVSRIAHEAEFRSILIGMVIAALIVGVYFVYDSYMKMVLLHVSDYQLKAQQYGVERMGISPEDASLSRVGVQYRSMGLLDSHTVSGAWIGFGGIASLALLANRSTIIRSVIALGWLVLLVLGMNFTSIIAFMAVILVVHGWRPAGPTGLLKVRRSTIRVVVVIGILLAASVQVLLAFFPAFAERVIAMATLESSKVFNSKIDFDRPETSVITWTLSDIMYFFSVVGDRPSVLVFGSGGTAAGAWTRGGDVGFLDTIAILGIPMFTVVLFGLFRMARAGLKELHALTALSPVASGREFLGFGLSTALFIAIFEAHYSVWIYKSVAPILFLSLGMLRRYGRRAPKPLWDGSAASASAR